MSEYQKYRIFVMLHPDKVFGNLAMPASDFWDTGGFGKAQVAYMDKKFMYGAQKCGLTREEAVQRRAHLMGQGYSLEEAIALMWSVETEEDLAMFLLLSEEKPDYSGILDIDPEGLSDQMAFSMYYYSYVLDREGNTEELQAFCNGMLDYTGWPDEGPADAPGRSMAYLLIMAAGAHMHVSASSMAMAVAALMGEATQEEINELSEAYESTIRLSSLWDALYYMQANKSALVGPHSGDCVGFKISEMGRDRQGYNFGVHPYSGNYPRDLPDGSYAKAVVQYDTVKVSTEEYETAGKLNEAELLDRLRQIDEKVAQMYGGAMLSILNIVCSVNPAASLASSALMLLMGLANGDAAGAMGAGVSTVNDLAGRLGMEANPLGTAVAKGLIEIFKLNEGIGALSAEKQKEIED